MKLKWNFGCYSSTSHLLIMLHSTTHLQQWSFEIHNSQKESVWLLNQALKGSSLRPKKYTFKHKATGSYKLFFLSVCVGHIYVMVGESFSYFRPKFCTSLKASCRNSAENTSVLRLRHFFDEFPTTQTLS